MRGFLKWTAISFVILTILLAIAITATVGWRPILGPRTRAVTSKRFESTPQRLARGAYLATSVTACLGCHSEHDWKSHGAPIVPGTEYAGEVMPLPDLPGTVVASNISSDIETGIGGWSDDQLARAIREGVDRNGRSLFPVMPYQRYRTMSDEDLASIIVYLRTVPAVHRKLPRSEIIFPVKYLISSVPEPVVEPVSSDAALSSDPVRRGAYLVNVAGCADCHTPDVRGVPVSGMDFAGGAPRNGPWGTVASANLTPDDSGIKYYDETLFLQVMHTGYVRARELKPIMPYWVYGRMNDDDLKAIFSYLRTLKPVHHRVDNSEPPTLCKLCQQKHGRGREN